MSFKNLSIKDQYDSDVDNLVNEFYLPILSEATTYYRRSGFFSSSSLAVAAQGIGELIRKNGKMKLICNVNLSREDHDSLKKAIEDPKKFLEESSISEDLDNIEDEIEMDHVEALGWMLAKELLEIKIAFPKSKKGTYHPKVGVFYDGNDYISFSGSENESFSGMLNNIEEFKVFKSWTSKGKDWAFNDLDKFNDEWNCITEKTTVIDLPEAIKSELIKFAPHEKADLGLLKKDYDNIYKSWKKPLPARDYQSKAVENWFSNGCKGIFNMATGSGKTITALNCYKDLKDESDNNFLTIIACPQKHLVTQWIENIEQFFNNKILSTVDNNSWKKDLKLLIGDVKLNVHDFPFVLTTHKTFANKNFINILNKWDLDVFLIVDEVHGVGSSEYQKGLLPKYNYRLGLSATPERWFDDDGTAVLYDYFIDSVFEFTLEEAIEKGFLTEYEYWPHFIELDDDEFDEYMELTKKIAIKYEKNKNFEDLALTGDYIRRQSIIDHAKFKYDELDKILTSYGPWDHLLVYCSSKKPIGEKQIDVVERILSHHEIDSHMFTSKQKDRSSILHYFDKGKYGALIAMKCLDEGVDVKSAKNAILMASTSNPREHIQRRGRILRKSPGKDIAVIDDLIVVPKSLDNLSMAEKNLIKKEFDRYEEFMESAINDVICIKIYMDWRGIYG